MSKIGIFFADGCEEIEGLSVVDICRRADLEIVTISIMERAEIMGSHKITFLTDTVFEKVDFTELDGVILPGGMPGTLNLQKHDGVNQVIREFAKEGKLVAAICAAPSVLGAAGILEGKEAVCHPGFEEKLTGAKVKFENVAVDGNVITSRGMGTAFDFGLAIVKYFKEEKVVEDVKSHMVY
ncbi:MAG: DJ-1/PfpI family protein [Lachnospiraceae bacterium]|nr:DJ-1/PfpI family protein [Lachnospiraceae bacterium]